jgi:Undecaprenyl-phosphate galactose phosphotransferase WbaP
MADEGLNLHPVGSARLPSTGRRDRYFELVRRYRKTIVVGFLITGDLAAALAAISCTRLLISMTGLPSPSPRHVTASFVVLAFFLAGLYTGSGPGPYERFRQRAIAVLGYIAISMIASLPERKLAAFLIMQVSEGASLLLLSHYVEDMSRSLLMRLELWGAPTILIGAEHDCQELAQLLEQKPDIGLKPIGLIRTTEASNWKSGPLSLPVAGTTADFARIRLGPEIEVSLFASPRELAEVPLDCPAFTPSCRFLLVEDIHDIRGMWNQGPCARTRMIDRMIGIEIRRNLHSWQNRLLKRLLDMLVVVPVGMLSLPIVVLAATLIKLVDPGPAFYLQKRVGFNGKTVNVLKLRTMYRDGERLLQEHLRRDAQARAEWERFFKLRRDPRILPIVGKFLRRSSIDELPQLWNVFWGEMSLVGPRPLPAYHAEQFDQEFRSLRIGVLPGITGLWQVSSRSEGDLQVLQEQDLFYIRNWSLWLDFYILLQTVPAVLTAKGAR